MNAMSADSTGSEMFFAEFLNALSNTQDREGVLNEFISRYPQREDELRDLAGLNSALDPNAVVIPPPPPEQLGEFRIERLIKVGGMGEIYEAYHKRLERRVALKTVRRGWSTPRARERFIREQFVLAKLHHSNIVPIHTGGEDGPIQYFTMPFIHGSSLSHVIDEVSSLSSSNLPCRTPGMPEIVSRVIHNSDANPTTSSRQLALKTKLPLPSLPTERIKLSSDYFRSVARIMADVAEAVEYAHRAGVLHRDLKPANVMIEPSGQTWVIDFGLAARLQISEDDVSPDVAQKDIAQMDIAQKDIAQKDIAQNGATIFARDLTNDHEVGTVNYMAPERWQGKSADERCDIFSLGTMLYELLTLRRAFDGQSSAEIKRKILSGDRVSARMLVSRLPRDLEAIADKAMSVEPSKRYKSAWEFAEDLRRWIRFEPIAAIPTMPWKRLWLWGRRKPAVAAAVVVTVMASTCTAAAMVENYAEQTRAARRMSSIQLLQQELLSTHTAGWSENSWENVRKLIRENSKGDIKSLAAETRVGVDTQLAKQFDYFPANLAYNPGGNKLLMVKYVSDDLLEKSIPKEARHAQIWDFATHQMQNLPQANQDIAGPIAYRSDDEPLQLVWNKAEPNAISLWNLAKNAPSGRMEAPYSLAKAPLSWSITSDGAFASALVSNGGEVRLLVWETATGKLLTNFATTASVIELSPDGALVAAAVPNGVIEVWSVASGEKVASFSENHADILCFAWTKDRLQPLDASEPGWLLAAGATGGDLTIWDVARKSARSHCIGSCHEVFQLVFSPDGMTLASAGRTHPMLWNVSTGELLLRLAFTNTMTSIAYSAKGDSLAVGSLTAHGSPGSTQVFEIQEARGQQVMRGLRSRVAQVCISANNRIVAALTDNFQLAVWDLKRHRLLHVFQVPVGVYASSAGLAIDADERRIAIVTGKEAKVWDIDSGTTIKSVPLPPGYAESLVFQDANTLISARQESVDPDFPPVGRNIDPDTTPRVCRVRNLLSADPEKPFLTISDFKRSAASINVSPLGNRLLIEGYYEGGAVPEHRTIKLFELPSGKQLWEMPSDARGANAYRIHAIDSLGRVVAMAKEEMIGQILVDIESRIQIRENGGTFLKCLGARASMNVSSSAEPAPPHRPYLTIVHGEKNQELLRLGLIKSISDGIAISSDERFVVYGCADGSVVVTDLWSVQKRLAEVGLH